MEAFFVHFFIEPDRTPAMLRRDSSGGAQCTTAARHHVRREARMRRRHRHGVVRLSLFTKARCEM